MRKYELGDIVTIVNIGKLRQNGYSLKIQLYSDRTLEVAGVIYQPRGTRKYKLREIYSNVVSDMMFEPQMFIETGPCYEELKMIFTEIPKEIPS